MRPGADGPPWRYLYDGDRPVTSVEPSAADTDLEERTLIMGHQLRYMVSGPVDPGAWSRGEVRFSSARRAPGDQDAEVDVEATWDRSVTGIPILTVTAWDLAVALAEHTRQGADGPPDQVADSDPRSAP